MPEDDVIFQEDGGGAPTGARSQRLDKWLWYARVVKTRSLASALVTRGRVRVNRERTDKPSQLVKPGDVVTASVSKTVRVLKVLAPGTRRGPAVEARLLYEDLAPELPRGAPSDPVPTEGGPPEAPASAPRDLDSGRPSKKERRQIMRLKGQDRSP